MQLFKKKVRIYDPMKNKFISNDDVINKFGVGPDKVIDVQSLQGTVQTMYLAFQVLV